MNRKTMPTTYAAILGQLPMSGRPLTLCNNTTARLDTLGMVPVIIISLHGHDIVRMYRNDNVQVRHCGYPTVTTFDRIKRFLPARFSVTRQGGNPRLLLDGQWFDNVSDREWSCSTGAL